jgi:hypothetical protein
MNVKGTRTITLRINLTECISKSGSDPIEPRQMSADR